MVGGKASQKKKVLQLKRMINKGKRIEQDKVKFVD